MAGYYEAQLAAERLRRCYELAPPRVKQYLAAEIEFVRSKTKSTGSLLELGCGYGRVLRELVGAAKRVWGIDTSPGSLTLARQTVGGHANCRLGLMNAAQLGFGDRQFELVICIQNGISAFRVDQRQLLTEATRVTRTGGRVLFSSYATGFWADRLAWFRRQADEGLLGEIDEAATGDGVIVCKDGFRAVTVGPQGFRRLAAEVGVAAQIFEVDGSSLFCEILVE
jgi:2-polyprenyl-6-hydroxyphenyl methylase/3-demethylubiquinone-9 3-methyltransferase